MSEPLILYVRFEFASYSESCGCGYSVSVAKRTYSYCDRKGHSRRSLRRARKAFKAFDERRTIGRLPA